MNKNYIQLYRFPVVSLIGMKFNRLEVIDFDWERYAEDTKRKNNGEIKEVILRWLCRCDCMIGEDYIPVSIMGSRLKSGYTKSCGCYKVEKTIERNSKTNIFDVSGEYGIGESTDGKLFQFDLEDYETIKNMCWSVGSTKYIRNVGKNNHNTFLHRLIMNAKDDEYVDHINHDIRDNRKENLRISTNQENNFNKGLYSHNQSGVTGVNFDIGRNKYKSALVCGEKRISKRFDTFEEAVIYRRLLERKYFKEFRYDWNDDYEKLTNEYIENHPDWINEIK